MFKNIKIDLALDKQQWMRYHKTNRNQTETQTQTV